MGIHKTDIKVIKINNSDEEFDDIIHSILANAKPELTLKLDNAQYN